jgi:hypothetical protein
MTVPEDPLVKAQQVVLRACKAHQMGGHMYLDGTCLYCEHVEGTEDEDDG